MHSWGNPHIKETNGSGGVVLEDSCGTLNNIAHRLMCLNDWSLGDRTVWEGLGGVAFLDDTIPS